MNQISTEMISSEILACEEPQNSEPEKQSSPKRQRVQVDGETFVEVETRESERQVGEEVEPEEDVENPDAERARRDRMKSVPRPPSAEEQRLHRATHCPYRSWCPKCVAARAHRTGHVGKAEETEGAPQVSFDYCFLRRGGGSEPSIPVLVGKVRQISYKRYFHLLALLCFLIFHESDQLALLIVVIVMF